MKTDYIEREKALAMFPDIDPAGNHAMYMDEIRADILSIPAADVREVVLCKDCRHRDPEDHKCDSGEMERQGCPFKVADDYFCAYGER